MWITLLLISHPLFQGTKKTLVAVKLKFATIIKKVTGTDVDLSDESEVTKASMAFGKMFKTKYCKI